MAHPKGESGSDAVRLDFDRRLMLQFRGSLVTSDAGLLTYRELDDVLGLTEMAGDVLADARSGKNGRHALAGLFRQSVFGRLAGYEDVNDAERLRHDPAMRWIVGGKAAQRSAASPSQMGRFETQAFGLPEVLVAASASRLSCQRARKTRTLMPVWDSSGESRLKPTYTPIRPQFSKVYGGKTSKYKQPSKFAALTAGPAAKK